LIIYGVFYFIFLSDMFFYFAFKFLTIITHLNH